MSRVGRCIDNGPMEAFLGKLKAEMYYFQDDASLKTAIEDYTNYRRFQERLDGLAPLRYRTLLMTAA